MNEPEPNKVMQSPSLYHTHSHTLPPSDVDRDISAFGVVLEVLFFFFFVDMVFPCISDTMKPSWVSSSLEVAL